MLQILDPTGLYSSETNNETEDEEAKALSKKLDPTGLY